MRTTLSLDEDVLEAARKIAESRSESIGRVISDLVRRGLEARVETRSRSGFPVFKVPRNAAPIGPEDIKRAEDEA